MWKNAKGYNGAREQDIQSEMLETMHSLKEDLESIIDDNEKLLKTKVDQEEINKILLKSITCKKQNRQVGHTSSHDGQGPIKEESHK